MTEKNSKLKFTDSKKLILYTLTSLVVIILLQVIGYFTFLNKIPTFLEK